MGIIGLAASGVGATYDHLNERGRRFAVGAAWLGVALLMCASREYAAVYSSLDAMCRYTLRANPDAWAAHQMYAVALFAKGDTADGMIQAQEAVRMEPETSDTQATLALALEMEGNVPAAIGRLREAVRLAPDVMITHVRLAKCLSKVGRYGEAVREYDWLLQRLPGNAVILCNKGVCLGKMGRVREAVAQFREASAADPNLEEARENLDGALRQLNGETGASHAAEPH